MKTHCKYDALVPIAKLKPYEKNRNKHPVEQITRLAKLLQYQGIRSPIVVDAGDKKTIVKGHGTVQAIAENGWKEAPVVYQKFKDEDQRYAFCQSDNAIANWADLDFAGLNDDMKELGPDFDLEMLGIKDFKLDPSEKEAGEPEHVSFESYNSASVKQVVLYFKSEDYDKLIAKMDALLAKHNLEDYSLLVWKMVNGKIRT